MTVAEIVSPELVLVAEDLRPAAIAALPDRPWEVYMPPDRPDRAHPAEPPDDVSAARASRQVDLAADIIVYTIWHALLGTLLGFGIIAAVALGLLILSLFA